MSLDVAVPNLGDPAPDATLRKVTNGPVHLADLRGQAVGLVFYRGVW